MTVRGEISANALGFCQSHEHVCVNNDWMREHFPALVIDDTPLTLRELKAYKVAGGGALIDAQPGGAGRDAETLRRLSQSSGVHIVASTGFHRMQFYPEDHWIFRWKEAELTSLFAAELTQGMFRGGDNGEPKQQTDICAGQIKAALEAGPLDQQHQKLFSAAAQVSEKTGAPMMVHIEKDADPLMLLSYLTERGVRPEKLIFCHMDRAIDDLSVHTALLSRSVNLEYDTIARYKYHDDEAELSIIRHMVQAGFGQQILAGLDVTRERLIAYGGSPGLCFILKEFLPAMRKVSFSDEAIANIFRHNPAAVWSK